MKFTTIFTSAIFAAIVIAAPKPHNILSARKSLESLSSTFTGGGLLAGNGVSFRNVAGSK
jgi:threonine/homoserine/homoserine lactone efflux protein